MVHLNNKYSWKNFKFVQWLFRILLRTNIYIMFWCEVGLVILKFEITCYVTKICKFNIFETW
jgi:hypothetical protein